MKKFSKVLAALSLVLVAALVMVACGGPTTLYKADFTQQGLFGLYGSAQLNQDNTLTLKSVEQDGVKVGPSTYFGESDKNYDWQEGGMQVAVSFKVNHEELQDGEYAVWSLGLNEKDGKYLTELPAFFVGTQDGVKCVFKFTGVDNDYVALAAQQDAVLLADGTYTLRYVFATKSNGEVEVTVKVEKEDGARVYASNAQTFTVIEPTLHEGKDYTSQTVVKEDMVKGLRYLWLVRASVDVVVTNLEVAK